MIDEKSLDYLLKNLVDTYNQNLKINKIMKDIIPILKNYQKETSDKNFPVLLRILPKIDTKTKNLTENINTEKNDKITSIEILLQNLLEWAKKEHESEDTQRNLYKENFFNSLENNFKKHNLELKGHFPNFYCKNFKIKVDSSKYKLVLFYGGDEEKMLDIEGWNSNETASNIMKFYQFFSQLDYSKELDMMFKAYSDYLKKSNKAFGDWVPIISVMNEFFQIRQTENLKLIYPQRILFSFIIFKIVEMKIKTNTSYRIGKRTATHGAASSKEQHLWLPMSYDDLSGENVMYLNFSVDS
jgi:hypothetical protein